MRHYSSSSLSLTCTVHRCSEFRVTHQSQSLLLPGRCMADPVEPLENPSSQIPTCHIDAVTGLVDQSKSSIARTSAGDVSEKTVLNCSFQIVGSPGCVGFVWELERCRILDNACTLVSSPTGRQASCQRCVASSRIGASGWEMEQRWRKVRGDAL